MPLNVPRKVGREFNAMNDKIRVPHTYLTDSDVASCVVVFSQGYSIDTEKMRITPYAAALRLN